MLIVCGDSRCLAGRGDIPFFLSEQFAGAHSTPLQLCAPFDPQLIKICKSKLYLINVILCVQAVGV